MTKIAVLLGVLAMTVLPAAAGPRHLVPISGSIEATETDVVQFPQIFVSGSGSGNASHLGSFTLTFDVTVNLLTMSGPASFELVAANGDTIGGEGTGVAADTVAGVRIVETYMVTGGTGRFSDAAGSIIVERHLNPENGESSGSFAGAISF